jgi:hypothetical protein
MLRHKSHESARPGREVRLTIDDTTAHITAPAALAGELLAYFRGQAIGCRVNSGGAVGGLDLIDFGNPTPAQEKHIRRVFAQWLSG